MFRIKTIANERDEACFRIETPLGDVVAISPVWDRDRTMDIADDLAMTMHAEREHQDVVGAFLSVPVIRDHG